MVASETEVKMKKAFDQTVRDLKREVNKKVLKVPGIEQKVLDATSNEPWGPHGSHLADIADATRNYHEYQMIMAVIWKRINDVGKNWRHVYKALTVLEYMVAHGSERVIDEIREHVYQISTLSDFQYIDSRGNDQGNNVRKKSQSLVLLVNDKERIQEARAKAAANREKFRNPASGSMYRTGSYTGGFGGRNDNYEGRYGSRDEDRNGYGREREWGYRDDDRYGKYGDTYNRDGDRYGRAMEERQGRDGYRDNDYRGRSRSVDFEYGSRSRSSDRDKHRADEDDGQHSSRGSGAKAEDHTQDGRPLDRKFSEQNLGNPPSYEEAVGDSSSERNGVTSAAPVPRSPSPTVSFNPNQVTTTSVTSGAPATVPVKKDVDGFDEFDPRGSSSGAPTTSNGADMDLLGSLSENLSLALVPVTPYTSGTEGDASASSSEPTYVAAGSKSTAVNQSFGDPFGEGPFRATTSTESISSRVPNTNQTFPGAVQDMDILADILPPSGPSPPVPAQAASGVSTVQPVTQTVYPTQNMHQIPSHSGQPGYPGMNFYGSYPSHSGPTAPVAPHMASHATLGSTMPLNASSVYAQSGYQAQGTSHALQTHTGPIAQPTNPMASQPTLPASTGSLAIVPQIAKDKFEPKSAIWADTLSRGLVNFNISGPKTNPLSDIGVDFEALNRKEKRMEKPSQAAITSTITMGKAMGSGSGIGRAGASALRPPLNPTVGSGMGMGGYGGMNQPMGMNMGMGMGMGMGMNYGMQRPMGFPPGSANNPMMGAGGYGPQQPYGGGYRSV